MSKICQSFAWYLPHIWLRFTWYLSEIWMRFAWNFPGICCKLRGPIWVFLIFFLKKKSSNWLGNLNDFTYPYSLQIYKVLGLVLGMWFCPEKFAMQADMTKKKNAKRSRQHARIHWRSSSTEGHLSPKVVFHQMLSSTEGSLPLKDLFHWRLSSTKGRLPPAITHWLILYLWEQPTNLSLLPAMHGAWCLMHDAWCMM